jgi:hypothetical protein
MVHTNEPASNEAKVSNATARKTIPLTSTQRRTKKALPRLLRRQRDERRLDELPAHRDAAEIGGDVVHRHHRHREEEPEDALEEAVEDELALADDQAQRDDRPHHLVELEFDQAGPQGEHRRHEQRRVHGECAVSVILRDLRQPQKVFALQAELVQRVAVCSCRNK